MAAIASAIVAFEIGTLYGSSGLRVSRGAGALIAAMLVTRWTISPTDRHWLDLGIALVSAYTLLRQLWHPRMYGRFMSWGLAMMSALYAGGLLSFAVLLRSLPNGFTWVALALTVTWCFDTSSYAIGTVFGRRGFMTHISPRKTWEGFAGGICAAIVVVAAFSPLLEYEWWLAVPLGLFWSLTAQAGDLVASMLKRDTGQKNSGRIIPGHGGLLDRVDSLLFVFPAVFVIARLVV